MPSTLTDQDRKEWEHIAMHNAAKADVFRTVLEIAPGIKDEVTVRWLNIERKLANEQRIEAEQKLAG